MALNVANTLNSSYSGPVYHPDWIFLLKHLAYINAFTGEHFINWAYWTLAVEFQFYLLLSVIFPFLVNSNKKILFATFFLLLPLCYIAVPHRPYLIFAYLPFFLMGISLFLYMSERVKVKEFFVLYAASVVVFFTVRHPDVYDMVLTLGAIPAIYYIKRVPKPLLWMGTISYSLYLTHMPLTTRFMSLFNKYLHLNFNISWALTIVLVCACRMVILPGI